MIVQIKLSPSAMTEKKTVKPLVAKATKTAKVMAQALFDDAHTEGKRKKVTFSVKHRAYISDEYMRLLGSRFSNKEFWKSWAKNQRTTDGKRAALYVHDSGWSWKSGAFWHNIARKNDASFDRTGGMWSGLRVRNFGANAGIIEFAGRSEGQSGEYKKKRGRVREGETRAEVFSTKVNNAFKAWTVFGETGVLVVAPSKAAQDALEDAVLATATSWSVAVVGGSITPNDTATSGLARAFQDAMRG